MVYHYKLIVNNALYHKNGQQGLTKVIIYNIIEWKFVDGEVI